MLLYQKDYETIEKWNSVELASLENATLNFS